ncbi:hypothetical protein CLOL250_00406 [Clostridium sp. L2-50]|nr:hypothetical protein CLOL250_00406 [Clostridium sp. L2-50]
MNKYRTVLLFLSDYKNFFYSDKNRTVFTLQDCCL